MNMNVNKILSNKKAVLVLLFVVVFCVVFYVTCAGGKNDKSQQFLPVVGAVKVLKQDYPMITTYPGQVVGSHEIEIRAQVSGILKERTYTEGQFVEAGTQLFLIDPVPYQIALDRASAEHNRAKRDYERMKSLYSKGVISQKQYDDALYVYESSQANFHEAQVNLGYTKVSAPISGIVRREAKSVGNLVSAMGESGLLTSMVQINPLHVNFSIPAAQVKAYSKNINDGVIGWSDPEQKLKVEALLSNDVVFPEEGKIIFSDSSEDVSTASVAFKAEFPNPEEQNKQRAMMPGQFIRIRLSGIVLKDVALVPSNALIKIGNNVVVYVIDNSGVVSTRPVKVTEIDNIGVVTEGLDGSETVVTEGIIKVRPNMTVKPEIKDFKV